MTKNEISNWLFSSRYVRREGGDPDINYKKEFVFYFTSKKFFGRKKNNEITNNERKLGNSKSFTLYSLFFTIEPTKTG